MPECNFSGGEPDDRRRSVRLLDLKNLKRINHEGNLQIFIQDKELDMQLIGDPTLVTKLMRFAIKLVFKCS